MSNIEEILSYNRKFVDNREYDRYLSDRFPRTKTAILTCMDTRLVELLPAALGIKNGDVKMIKTAGARLTNLYDGCVRSLLIGIAELGVEEILVIGHTECGVEGMHAQDVLSRLRSRGISQEVIDTLEIDYNSWLSGFDSIENNVRDTVKTLLLHPLIPKDVKIYGYVINIQTGELMSVKEES